MARQRTTFRNGKPQKAYRDNTAAKERAKSRKKWKRDISAVQVREKYGPSRRSAPVTVRHLDGMTGEWVTVGVVHQRDVRGLARGRDAG